MSANICYSLLILLLTTQLCAAEDQLCFNEAAARYNVSPDVLYGIAMVENRKLNPNAVNWNKNGTYDFGIMQINTIHEPLLRKNGIPWSAMSDPCTNIMVGAWLLSMRIREHGYNWKGIGSYHSQTPSKRDGYARQVARQIFSSGFQGTVKDGNGGY